MKYGNLTVIGTSHIASESLNEVRKVIEEEKPDIIALELDNKRLSALVSKKQSKFRWADVRRIGIKGYLFSLIGAYAEKKLGAKVGVSPGSEMLSAFRLAKKSGAKVALIDQDIEITLRRFSDSLTWLEKWHFVADILKAIIFRKSEISFDLSSVPDSALIHKMISQVKKRYPNIYRVLIVERNKVMARNLASIHMQFPESRIVAIVGAGHEDAIIKLFKQEIRG